MLQVYLIFLLFCKVCACTEVIPVCENNDENQVNGTCKPSVSCSLDNSNTRVADNIENCFQSSYVPDYDIHQYDQYYGPDVTSCLNVDSLFLRYYHTPCEPVTDERHSVSPFGLPNSVTATLSSIGIRHFNMSVTWEHSDAEHATNLRGYQILIRKPHKTDNLLDEIVDCFCVRNISQRKLEIPTHPFLKYDPEDYDLDVSVSTFPRHIEYPSPQYTSTTSHEWPQNCLKVPHIFDTCYVPRYEPPSNLTVTTSLHSTAYDSTPGDTALMEAMVSWDPPVATSDTYILPSTYYVTFYAEGFFHTFSAVGTQSIRIAPLNASMSYTILIQAYAPCTGFQLLSQVSVNLNQCGRFSVTVLTSVDLTHPQPVATTTTTIPTTTTKFPSTTTYTSTFDTVQTTASSPADSTSVKDNEEQTTSVTFVFIVVSVVLLLLVILTVDVALVILLYQHFSRNDSTLSSNSPQHSFNVTTVDPRCLKNSLTPITSTV